MAKSKRLPDVVRKLIEERKRLREENKNLLEQLQKEKQMRNDLWIRNLDEIHETPDSPTKSEASNQLSFQGLENYPYTFRANH